MIDFGPLLSNPKMFLFGAAAQFGIFFTLVVAKVSSFQAGPGLTRTDGRRRAGRR